MPSIGQTYTLSGQVKTGSAPGQEQWTLGSGQQVKILNQRNVGGELYYDVQHIGGGTGWLKASALDSALNGNISASDIKPPVNVPKSSNSTSNEIKGLQQQVDSYKKQLEQEIAEQTKLNEQKLNEARKKEAQALGDIKTVAGEIRQDVEGAFNELQPGIMEDFEERRNLVNRLESLLTEGQNYIEQQQNVTGLASVRNPRIQRAIEDVAAEAGIIQSVISARDGNIQQAFNIINGKIGVIMTARQEELNYFKTVLELASRDVISLDSESKKLAEMSITTAKKFLDDAMNISNYVKELLVNPSTAGLMDGVKLTDSIETIQRKVADNSYNREVADIMNKMATTANSLVYDPSTVPASELLTITDSRGVEHYFRKEAKVSTAGASVTSSSYTDSLRQSGASKSATSSNKSTQTSRPPSYTPASGTGTYVDPQTGDVWRFENSRWRKLL